MTTCVFCGYEGRLTKEHVIPKWMRPYVTSPWRPGIAVSTILRRGVAPHTKHRPKAGPAELTYRCVCKSCNEGWMSRLENTTKPLLRTLVQGHGGTFYEESQKQLSTWAMKTALVAGSRFEPPTPESFYKNMYASRQPTNGTRVWVAAVNRPYATYIDHRPAQVAAEGETPPAHINGFATLLGVAHMIFYLFARDSDEPPDTEFGTLFKPAFQQIWPYVGPVSHPAKMVLEFDKLDDVADTLGKVE